MKNPTRTTILLLFLGIITALFLIAKTDLLEPVMRFILTTDQGTPLELMGCIIAAILGLRLAWVLLNMVGQYYAGELDVIQDKKMHSQGGKQP